MEPVIIGLVVSQAAFSVALYYMLKREFVVNRILTDIMKREVEVGKLLVNLADQDVTIIKHTSKLSHDVTVLYYQAFAEKGIYHETH